ncbi:hypothetical protein AVEN_96561-1 [Araneus ventricosus]|uniref:Uncharacterized protein n=1 Tax=Araneus ventricosus TaxID=182803 RepID=A0A4Y2H5R6_ARAVE|nr:hypothetical protein AVEN_96561-1 [Araneus ventricosus]
MSLWNRVLEKNEHQSQSDKRGRKNAEIALFTAQFLHVNFLCASSIRPRSFLYIILHGIALFVKRKFGSNNFVNVLLRLGFCASYHEAQQLEQSIIYHPVQPTPAVIFCRYNVEYAGFNHGRYHVHYTVLRSVSCRQYKKSEKSFHC